MPLLGLVPAARYAAEEPPSWNEEIASEICDLVGLLLEGEVAAVEQVHPCARHVALEGRGLRGLEGRVVVTPGHQQRRLMSPAPLRHAG